MPTNSHNDSLDQTHKARHFWTSFVRFATPLFNKLLKLAPHPLFRHILSTLIGTTLFAHMTPIALLLLICGSVICALIIHEISTYIRFDPSKYDKATIKDDTVLTEQERHFISYLKNMHHFYKNNETFYFLIGQTMSDFTAIWHISQQILQRLVYILNPGVAQIVVMALIISAVIFNLSVRGSYYDELYSKELAWTQQLSEHFQIGENIATHNPVSSLTGALFTLFYAAIQVTLFLCPLNVISNNLRLMTPLLKHPLTLLLTSGTLTYLAIKKQLVQLSEAFLAITFGVASSTTASYIIENHLLQAARLFKLTQLFNIGMPVMRVAAAVSGYCYSRNFFQYLRRGDELKHLTKKITTSQEPRNPLR